MIGELDPIEGNWYHHLDKGQDFMVVDVNRLEGIVDIQYFDEDMDLEEVEPPEDWTGPLDEMESDDLGYE